MLICLKHSFQGDGILSALFLEQGNGILSALFLEQGDGILSALFLEQGDGILFAQLLDQGVDSVQLHMERTGDHHGHLMYV